MSCYLHFCPADFIRSCAMYQQVLPECFQSLVQGHFQDATRYLSWSFKLIKAEEMAGTSDSQNEKRQSQISVTLSGSQM